LLARRLSRVTGERWPVPARATTSDNSDTGAPTSDHSDTGAATTWVNSGTRATSNSDDSGTRATANSDNSKKRGGPRGLSQTVDVWAPSSVPKRPPSAPSPGNGTRRLRAALPGQSAAWQLAARLAGGGTLAAARPLGSAISRTWWPVAIPAAVAVRRLRLPVAALILAPPLLDWADRRPPLDPARYVAARLLDDAAYSLGVWQGCFARRTVRPLLPVIGARRQPGSRALPGRRQPGGTRFYAGGWAPVVR
jgi:hypothetical protein